MLEVFQDKLICKKSVSKGWCKESKKYAFCNGKINKYCNVQNFECINIIVSTDWSNQVLVLLEMQ